MRRPLRRANRTGRERLSDEELDRIAALTRRDVPPEDKWAAR